MNRRPLAILLDANIWRFLADEPTAAGRAESIARKRDLDIIVAPSVVYEALRTKDVSLRDHLVRVMTRPQWQPVMPEAFSECEELLGELRRIHPDWIVARDTKNRERNRIDWLPSSKGGFWTRLRNDPATVVEHLGCLEGETIARAREEALARRKAADSVGWKFHGIDLAGLRGGFLQPVSGWNGDDVDAWRLSSLAWASRAAGEPPYSDWLAPYFSLTDIRRRADWVRFWLYEVEPTRMPRWWIRAACEILQSLRKVTPGTPCDAQLASYTVKCDLFISQDRALIEILKCCRSAAPFFMGVPYLLSGSNPLRDLFDLLERARRLIPALQ